VFGRSFFVSDKGDVNDIRLARLGHRRKNRVKLCRESHLEEPIRLIEDHVLHLGQRKLRVEKNVLKTPRRRHNYLETGEDSMFMEI